MVSMLRRMVSMLRGFLKQVNPSSLVELSDAKFEESLSTAAVGERFQFERNGYFIVDKYSCAGGPLIFNRTLGLKDTAKPGDNVRSRKDEQDKQKAEKEAKKNMDPKEMFRSQTDLY